MANISKDNIILELIARADNFDRTLKAQNKKVTGFANTISKAQKAVVGFFAAKLSKDLVVGLANTAAGLELLAQKANTVFGDSLPKVTKAAQENAIALGLTRAEYVASAAAIQDLLVPMGFARETAANISIELTNLSGALAEWSGGQRTAAEVSEILNKALLGERESLKSLGISITENDVKTRLAEKGLKDLTGTTLQQAKAAATLELITEKSTDAQAAFAAGSETLARRQRELSAVIRDTAQNISNELLFVFQELAGAVDANELNQILQRVVASFAAVFTVFKATVDSIVNESVIAFKRLQVLAKSADIAIGELLGQNENQLRAETAVLQQEIEKRIELRKNPFVAGQEAFERSLKRQQEFIQRAEADQTQTQTDALKKRNAILSKEQQKANEQRLKEQQKAQENIADLQNALIADAQERAIAEAKTKTQRLIQALVGSPEQITEQTELIGQVLDRELTRIQREAFQVIESIQTLDPTDTEQEVPPIVARFVESLSTDQLSKAGDELNAEVIAIAKDLSNTIAQSGSEFEDVSPFGRLVEDLFTSESDLRQELDNILTETSSFFREMNDQRIRAVDEEISIQQKRVDALNKTDSKATAEQIELEEQRLAKLQTEREKFIQQQRSLAAAEIAINAAATIPAAIRSIVEGFQGEGGFITGVLKAGALAATIASTIAAVRGALAGVPSLAEGTERLQGPGTRKSDSIPINASRDERVVPGDINERIGFDFPNKKLPEAVAFYKKYNLPGPSQEAINAPLQVVKVSTGDLLAEMKRMRKSFDRMKVEFNVSDDGIYAAVTKQQRSIDHRKKLSK